MQIAEKIKPTTFNLSNEQIEDYFIDYVDSNKFKIVRGYIDSYGARKGMFFTDIGSIKKENTLNCINIEIKIKMILGEIYGRGAGTMSGFKEIEELLDETKQFFGRIGKEPAFYIKPEYDHMILSMYVIGELIKEETFKCKERRESILKDLSILLKKKTSFRSIKMLNPNCLQITPPKILTNSMPYIIGILRNAYNGEHIAQTQIDIAISELVNRIREEGYRFDFGAGDTNLLIRLRK